MSEQGFAERLNVLWAKVGSQVPVILAVGLSLRLLLDLDALPLNTTHGLMAMWAVIFVAFGWQQLAEHPLRTPLVAFVGWSALGLAHGGTPEAVRYGLHLWVPLLWLLASERAHSKWPRLVLIVGLLPIGWSLLALAQGQPGDHVLDGLPRLHGGYRNLYGHAVAMAALAVLGAWQAQRTEDKRRWRRLGALVGVLACVALLFTWVRTSWSFVAIGVGALLVFRQHWRALAGWLMGFAALMALSSPLWGSVGSWRGHIWLESLYAFAAGPWWTWVVGRGLGEHVGLHEGLDPHNEYLSILFQLGVVGLVLWMWLMGAAMWVCLQAGRSGRLGAALLLAVLLTCAMSDAWLTRATLQWVTFGAVGLAVASSRQSRR
jgi:hypothetical protein